MTTTSIYGFDRYGGPEVAGRFEVPEPVATPGLVGVELVAASLNPADIKVRNGQRVGRVAVRFPMAMGREAAGRIVDPADSGFAVGELVFGSCAEGTGALAQRVVLEAAQACPVPHGVSAEQAACIPVAIGTAWDALVETGVGPGDVVLVTGAGGGVGIHAVQLARHLGAAVVGLAGPEKAAAVTAAGATHVATGEGAVQRLAEMLPQGASMVLDTVGAPLLAELGPLLGDPGRLRSPAAPATAAQLGGSGVTRRRTARVYAELADLVARGVVTPVIAASLPLARAGDAVRILETARPVGKVVITA